MQHVKFIHAEIAKFGNKNVSSIFVLVSNFLQAFCLHVCIKLEQKLFKFTKLC